MSYFNYHAKVKKIIIEGKLKYYYFDDKYKNIGFALVLCFEDKKYPIREKRFEEYFKLIGEYYTTTKNGNICYTKSVFDKKNK